MSAFAHESIIPTLCLPSSPFLLQVPLLSRQAFSAADVPPLLSRVTLPQLKTDVKGAPLRICVAVPAADAQLPAPDEAHARQQQAGDLLLLVDLTEALEGGVKAGALLGPEEGATCREGQVPAVSACVVGIPKGLFIDDLAFYRNGQLAALLNSSSDQSGWDDGAGASLLAADGSAAQPSGSFLVMLSDLQLHPVEAAGLQAGGGVFEVRSKISCRVQL